MEYQDDLGNNPKVSIPQLRLDIFRASEKPDRAWAYLKGHQAHIKSLNIDGLRSADDKWQGRPEVYIMALWMGKEMVAGSRLEVYHPEHTPPFMRAIEENRPEHSDIMFSVRGENHAEWCGLWANSKVRGLGTGGLLTDVALTTAHSLGLSWMYGICPRHTLDPFREIGFRLWTSNDAPMIFPYPNKDFPSYVVKCQTDDLDISSRRVQKVVDEYLSGTKKEVYCSGKLGDSLVVLCPFPEKRHQTEEPFEKPSKTTVFKTETKDKATKRI